MSKQSYYPSINSLPMALLLMLLLLLSMPLSMPLYAHGVDDNTRAFLSTNAGMAIVPFIYIGAKHMVSGYDHLLFLFGVLFFLYRAKDVFIYVSLFTLGHSVTLLYGVLVGVQINAFLIDAIIGFSIVYKGFDNLGGFKAVLGYQPNTRWAVLIFGLFHGLGLATKLQDFQLPDEGLLLNIVAFNLGVEVGQCFALLFVLIVLSFCRRSASFFRFSVLSNTVLMSAGWLLFAFHFINYLREV